MIIMVKMQWLPSVIIISISLNDVKSLITRDLISCDRRYCYLLV